MHWARGDEVSGIFTTVTPSQLAKFNTLFPKIDFLGVSFKYLCILIRQIIYVMFMKGSKNDIHMLELNTGISFKKE